MDRAYVSLAVFFLLLSMFAGDTDAGCICSGNIGYLCTGPGNTNCLPNPACNWVCSSWADVGHTVNQQFINNNFNTWQQAGEGQSGYPPGHDQHYDVGPPGDSASQAINDLLIQFNYSYIDPKNDLLRILENMIANNLWDEKHINEFLKLLEIPEKEFWIFYEKRDKRIKELLEHGYSRPLAELEANKETAIWITEFIPVYVADYEDDVIRYHKESGITKNLDSTQSTPYVTLNKSILCPFASLSNKNISIPLVIR